MNEQQELAEHLIAHRADRNFLFGSEVIAAVSARTIATAMTSNESPFMAPAMPQTWRPINQWLNHPQFKENP